MKSFYKLITVILLFAGCIVSAAWAAPLKSEVYTAADPIKIVVIGSSTAAGYKVKPADAWVSRYRAYLQAIDPTVEVINLAEGGFNTYHLMPTGFSKPGRESPDVNRNITKALSLHPDAIIINLPSNDAAKNYGKAEQMQNFAVMYEAARKQNVPVWITTTQPRNTLTSAQNKIQLSVKNAILATYGDHALNFWGPLTTYKNSQPIIKPALNSGDGIHVNAEGHRLLFEEVKSQQIYEQLAPTLLTSATTYLSDLAWYGTPHNDLGPIEKDQSNGKAAAGDGGPITIRSKTYKKGLGVHANSSVTYQLKGQYQTFFTSIGLDINARSKGTVVFEIYTDNKLAYRSSVMTGKMNDVPVKVSVSGVNLLKLVVTDAGDGYGYDHADWADARLEGSQTNKQALLATTTSAKLIMSDTALATAPLFSLFPNPASQQVQVVVDAGKKAVLRIYNAQGQQVYLRPLAATCELDIAALTPGIYLIKVQQGSVMQTERLVVE